MKPATLLIVDDDPVFTMFVRQLILGLHDDFPCIPHCVDDPEKALNELTSARYDLVLLDYHLPGTDGLHVLEQIRGLPAQQQPAVIMLTGSGNEMVAVQAMKCGARDYLMKNDLDKAPLLRSLRSALAQKQLADQVALQVAQAGSELEMARHFQRSLLPDTYPSFPQTVDPPESALRFCHRFFPASELAGDFFSVLRLSDTQAGVFICDVMGHGVRSALVTAILRALVDYAAPRAGSPGKFLAAINQRLVNFFKSAESPLFATAFYLVADVGHGRLRYATAGHPSPLHLQTARGVVVPLQVPPRAGPALGLFREATYVPAECPLESGDVVLLFTDGLFEATRPIDDEEYGRERLLAAAQKHMFSAPSDLCDALIAEVRVFVGGAPLNDDLCLLSVEAAHVCAERTASNIQSPPQKFLP